MEHITADSLFSVDMVIQLGHCKLAVEANGPSHYTATSPHRLLGNKVGGRGSTPMSCPPGRHRPQLVEHGWTPVAHPALQLGVHQARVDHWRAQFVKTYKYRSSATSAIQLHLQNVALVPGFAIGPLKHVIKGLRAAGTGMLLLRFPSLGSLQRLRKPCCACSRGHGVSGLLEQVVCVLCVFVCSALLEQAGAIEASRYNKKREDAIRIFEIGIAKQHGGSACLRSCCTSQSIALAPSCAQAHDLCRCCSVQELPAHARLHCASLVCLAPLPTDKLDCRASCVQVLRDNFLRKRGYTVLNVAWYRWLVLLQKSGFEGGAGVRQRRACI
eukprot:1161233-Pelagomonas_calceolata.AAC.16